jgi:hypothetical protein
MEEFVITSCKLHGGGEGGGTANTGWSSFLLCSIVTFTYFIGTDFVVVNVVVARVPELLCDRKMSYFRSFYWIDLYLRGISDNLPLLLQPSNTEKNNPIAIDGACICICTGRTIDHCEIHYVAIIVLLWIKHYISSTSCKYYISFCCCWNEVSKLRVAHNYPRFLLQLLITHIMTINLYTFILKCIYS